MNIAIQDIQYLEKKFNEKPCSGKVWELAQQGKIYIEILETIEKEVSNKKEE